jgi:hypothetical protein
MLLRAAGAMLFTTGGDGVAGDRRRSRSTMIALKELLELLAAGSQMIPLADNDEVYRRLEERLESLHADDHVERSPPKAA